MTEKEAVDSIVKLVKEFAQQRHITPAEAFERLIPIVRRQLEEEDRKRLARKAAAK